MGRFTSWAKVLEMANLLNANTTVTAIELARVHADACKLEGVDCRDVAPEDKRTKTIADVKEGYRVSFVTFVARVQIGDFPGLYAKYSPLVKAAETWDFTNCDYITKEEDKEVLDKDLSRLDAIHQNAEPNLRGCEALSRALDHNPEDKKAIDAIIADLKNFGEKTTQTAILLATASMCKLLCNPRSKTFDMDFKQTLQYVTGKRLKIKVSTLPKALSKRVANPSADSALASAPNSSAAASSSAAADPVLAPPAKKQKGGLKLVAKDPGALGNGKA